MKNILNIFLIIFFSFTFSAYSSEWDYHTTRIPTDDIESFYPTSPRINDSGNVIFTNMAYYIYFWDKTQLSNLYTVRGGIGSDLGLTFNNSNDIVYSEGGGTASPLYIYLNGNTISPDDQRGCLPSINNKGEVVWIGFLGDGFNMPTDVGIYFWDKTTITTIASGGNLYLPTINDNSHIVWSANNNLFLWNGSTISQITNNTDPNLHIIDIAFNNNGDIAYSYDNHQLYFYNGVTKLITDSCLSPLFNMNDLGEIVWTDSGDIFIYKNGEISKVTDDSYTNSWPDINNNGEIVYTQYDPNYLNEMSIIIATPIPEPSVIFLFFFGFLFLFRKKR